MFNDIRSLVKYSPIYKLINFISKILKVLLLMVYTNYPNFYFSYEDTKEMIRFRVSLAISDISGRIVNISDIYKDIFFTASLEPNGIRKLNRSLRSTYKVLINNIVYIEKVQRYRLNT